MPRDEVRKHPSIRGCEVRISLACDHAGFPLKKAIQDFLLGAGHSVEDYGCKSKEPVDLPDFAYPAALALSQGRVDRAILIDGAGYPSAMIANCLWGVYAAVANDPLSARFAREHSDANALCLGGKVIGEAMGLECVRLFLELECLGGKYARRIEKIRAIAQRHRLPSDLQPLKVLTVEDLRVALERKRPILLDERTLLTPSVQDLVHSLRS